MIKIKIVKNKEIIFESNSDYKYSSEKTIDWNALRNADLSNANLSNANLSNAPLRYADLRYADLRNADLSGANLRYANLRNANLRNANLRHAYLSNAYLSNAALDNTQLDEEEKCRKGMILKRKIIGYKKCRNDIIVKLEIPRGAIVFSINNNKCRTNIAKIIDIDNNLSKVKSKFEENFIYKKGEIIEIDDFNLMYNVECGSGIHFFRTRKEAVDYEL